MGQQAFPNLISIGFTKDLVLNKRDKYREICRILMDTNRICE
jgi:hypothetical protein